MAKDFKPPRAFWYMIAASVVLTIVVLICYLIAFHHQPFSKDPNDWDAFGGYVGGTLGAIFGFAGFAALLYTVFMQREELALSRQELVATREELARSAKAQEQSEEQFRKQSELIEFQKFESLLFNLIEKITQSYEKLMSIKSRHGQNGDSQSVVVVYGNSIKAQETYELAVEKSRYHISDDIRRLHKQVYEVLFFIATNMPNRDFSYMANGNGIEEEPVIAKEIYYVRLVRTFLSVGYVGTLIAYCGLESDDKYFSKFKKLLIRYEFFSDHSPAESMIKIFKNDIKADFPPKAFGLESWNDDPEWFGNE